jgi:hypothetical protein
MARAATIDPAETILALTIIDRQFAEPGTEVSVVWGEYPGAGTSPDADLGFPRIRATVAPAPYDATRGRNTGAPNCARVLLWSAPIMYFARRVFAR